MDERMARAAERKMGDFRTNGIRPSETEVYSSPRMGPTPKSENGDRAADYLHKIKNEPTRESANNFQSKQPGVFPKESGTGVANERVNTISNGKLGAQANYTSLSYDQVMAASNELNTLSGEMVALLDDVKRLFSKIGEDGVWSGTAAASTKETFDALSAKFPQFYEAINDCSKYLSQVVANYQSVDNAMRRG